VDDIKMNLRELGWGGMDWIDLAHDIDQWRAPANNVRTPDSIKCWEILELLHNWRPLEKLVGSSNH
jgi:hypothetical protein